MSGYDPLAVAFYDIAHEGAQLRLIASAIEASVSPEPDAWGVVAKGLADLEGVRPRSLVIVTDGSVAKECAELALSFFQPLACPVVVCEQMPGFVGALDVVVVLSETGHNVLVQKAVSQVASRGIPVVLCAPKESPLQAEAPDDVIVLDALPTHEGSSVMRFVGLVMAVVDLADTPALLVAQKLKDYADAVDEELVQCSPERDEFVNPARELADIPGQIVHVGFVEHGERSAALARLVSRLWSGQGKVCAALNGYELAQARGRNRGAEADIFHDPLLDGPRQLLPLKAIVWCGPNDPECADYSVPLPDPAPVGVVRLAVRAFAATAFFAA
ncbi:hypothetical protein P4N68_04050 [Corynebacterium felinum]|uniref:Uncharacterized protein n=1 Tax=Corynebacterium felinum TaxID=131318 RepID=A0ABU2B8G8_9CORY|nr:hypothetical protein [Corynebacterium felinum]MDF5820258.1 hypothetical protein [Corynebacterium felinum]MDR7354901.1 hypothetical protein [Corynebacterium felinum]WJY94261.1 hypothetical protein CFELI_03095 [Corynebacterium felinum]